MTEPQHRYFIVHKPRKMVSQFVSSHKVKLLSHLEFDFPEGTHAIGRLDNNAEGILLLTTNKRITRLLFEGPVPHKRVYVVLVRFVANEEQVELLRRGIELLDIDGQTYTSSPCDVEIIDKPTYLHDDKYIYRELLPHSWLKITLTEGRFHQVRKMVAAIGHQVLRLVRVAIEEIELGDMPVGSVKEIDEESFFRLLHLEN